MKFVPYWLDTAPPFTGANPSPPPAHADVVVIGGGLNGVSAALALAQRGVDVVLLEQDDIGSSASGRNGGMCTTGLAIGFGEAVSRYGAQRATQMFQAYNKAIDCVEQLVTAEQIDCHFARCGRLTLACKPAHYDRFVDTQRLLEQYAGQDTRLVPKAELGAEIGTDRYYGGWLDPLGSGLHVGKFVRGLAEVAARNGAKVYPNTGVTGLRRVSGHCHDVVMAAGTVRAQQVLLATGSKTGRPFDHFRKRIVPVGSYIIVTEPLSEEMCNQLMPTRRMISDTKHFLYYFRITPDNRMLFGGRARFSSSDPHADAHSGRILHRGLIEVFPQLADARIDYCWGGLVDLTRDRMPRAGEHKGVFYSMGYSGHGVQMSTYMGVQMAEVMTGNSAANVWRELEWPAVPAHFSLPVLLPLVGAYYRLQDVLH